MRSVDALNFIERNTKTGWHKTENGGREEVRSYPKEAIREALVNAIAHRDYSIAGTQIDVDIYSDRIEIVSPGSWLLPKDYYEYPVGSIPSIRRNSIIAACLDVANLMKRGGTGGQVNKSVSRGICAVIGVTSFIGFRPACIIQLGPVNHTLFKFIGCQCL